MQCLIEHLHILPNATKNKTFLGFAMTCHHQLEHREVHRGEDEEGKHTHPHVPEGLKPTGGRRDGSPPTSWSLYSSSVAPSAPDLMIL